MKAWESGLELRQTYTRLGNKASIMQDRYSRAYQYKRARRDEKNLKNYLGRVLRDDTRKLSPGAHPEWEALLTKCHRVYDQQRTDSHQLYSFMHLKLSA